MSLKQKLASRTPALGSWITLAHPAIAEIMCRAGFEWLAVDLEHSSITIGQAEELIRVIELCGAAPLVRLSANDPVLAKRVMDSGARGVIVPMVNSRADAERAVDAVYYPPRGGRGVGLARAQGYGAGFSKYAEWAKTGPVVIVQVEHIKAVEDLEAILAVDGVDGFIVGPYDLSASLGVPGDFEDPAFLAAMERIGRVGTSSGKAPGIHVVEPDIEAAAQRIEQGYVFLAYSLDIRMLDAASRAAVARLNQGGGA
ncbi:MAG: 2,4-dihydroxyhept-2-ene-1,7-dioic acid aldolase [Desulfovibrionaceae bacterium]|nr:2,4-dihydroxyhept-2-ene-1,7-dioic acid aldolase [Desulfovibrionaceae bacterium]